MIKASGETGDGRRFFVFGISRRNTELLLTGKPIRVDTEEAMGAEGGPVIFLVGGETEETIAGCLSPLVGPETLIHPTENKA